MNSDFCLCTVNPCKVTVHAQGKKKKKKRQDVKLENATIISVQTLTTCHRFLGSIGERKIDSRAMALQTGCVDCIVHYMALNGCGQKRPQVVL